MQKNLSELESIALEETMKLQALKHLCGENFVLSLIILPFVCFCVLWTCGPKMTAVFSFWNF